MDEKELLNQLSLLKSIKPSQDWALSVKQRILGVEYAPISPFNWVGQVGQVILFYSRKPAFAMAAFALLISAGLAIQVTNQRLSNDAVSLERQQTLLQARFAQVSHDFALLVENEPKKALQASRGIVQLQKEKSRLEKTLGAKFGEKESSDLENATKTLLLNEFSDLDSRTLRQDQLILLNEAKNAFTKQDYQTALEKVWELSN